MGEFAKEALGNLLTIIRVIASGLVSLLLLLILDPADKTQLRGALLNEQSAWLVLTGAGVCGVCAYALYLGIVENCFLWAVLLFIRLRFPREIPARMKSRKAIFSGIVTRELFRERKARYASCDERVKEMQTRMEAFYAWLVFLYCTFLLTVACAIVATHFGTIEHPALWGGALALGVGVVAFSADISITRDELWLVVNHPQWVKGNGSAILSGARADEGAALE